ncbi:MAG TPA: uroporphyrinogen-III synthase [Alphaproteobacteria bacterium]|nr:uroporphyrinogen-III synthase [Alphaproteobacteria bacterium]HNS43909.1 uroporphyrinogen-III synthase [Alphaproteobacteria bacterium]
MERRLILVTRPKEQAKEFAAEIERLGAVPVLCPLLDIHPVSYDLSHFSRPDAVPDAIIVTSQQVFSVGADFSPLLSVPVYCVGEKTGEAARGAGFADVYEAGGDVDALVALVRDQVQPSSRLLYLRGEDVRADIAALLAGYQVDEEIMYGADVISALPQDVIDLFPKLFAICLFSPRSGSILKGLMDKHGLGPFVKNINLLSLSDAVLESVDDLGWKTSRVADRKDLRSMIANLTSILDRI